MFWRKKKLPKKEPEKKPEKKSKKKEPEKKYVVNIFIETKLRGLRTSWEDLNLKDAKAIMAGLDKELSKNKKWMSLGTTRIRPDKIICYEMRSMED